jgi:hypothetical protein
MDTLNRSAIVVKPKQRFLDWLHTVDPTSHEVTLLDVCRERRFTSSRSAIRMRSKRTYFENRARRFSQSNWPAATKIPRPGLEIGATKNSANGSTTSIIPC